ncbi:MAG: hypothetical protein WCC28_03295 [Mycobacterium sp.]|uniref:hypothetical protein n=1 Tax=Mycobacterium sp. TaxID=1785 RepID=UPI003C72CBBA
MKFFCGIDRPKPTTTSLSSKRTGQMVAKKHITDDELISMSIDVGDHFVAGRSSSAAKTPRLRPF